MSGDNVLRMMVECIGALDIDAEEVLKDMDSDSSRDILEFYIPTALWIQKQFLIGKKSQISSKNQ